MAETRGNNDWGVVGFLASVGISVAYGIDASLPAFYEMRPDVGLPS